MTHRSLAFAPHVPRMCAPPPPPSPPAEAPRVCVLGAGVVGLCAARALTDAGFRVSVVARETVHSALDAGAAPYVSVGAGALWWPFHLGGRDADVRRWAAASYASLAADAEAASAGDAATGVALLPGYLLNARVAAPERPWYADLTGMELVSHEEDARVPPQYASAFRMTSPIVQPGVYLPWLHAHLERDRGVRFVTKLPSWALADVRAHARSALRASVVVNCTGLGAREEDDSVVPGRGVILVARRDAGPRPPPLDGYWWTEQEHDGFVSGRGDGMVAYAFPRGEGRAVLGGCVLPGEESRDASDAEVAALRSRVADVDAAAAALPEDARWVGLRPLRADGIRLERDAEERDVVHCYGHGGGGFTTAAGCADDVVALVQEALAG